MLIKTNIPLTGKDVENLYLDKPIRTALECEQCGYYDGNDRKDNVTQSINLKLNELNSAINKKLKTHRMYYTYDEGKLKIDVYHYNDHFDYIPLDLLKTLIEMNL